ncbi:glycosyltransferase family 4 protein [Castellaniella denitrificans]|uniref:glycosyltransferase family 4 protein n=1 Tax=Castellaniella denitrificans TaxID=56119 RepID=UPI001AD09B24|nr:glycosyltransferase family 4 protein [Burkholderiales bacterium]
MTCLAIISHHAVDLLKFRGHLIRDLAASGVRVRCLAPDYDAATRAELTALGAVPIDYRLQRTGMNPLRDLMDVARLIQILRRLAPDVVFAFSTKPMVYGTLAAWLAGVPRRVAMVEGAGYVFTASDGRDAWTRRALRLVVEVLYRMALGRAHRVIFLNPDDQREFVEWGLVARARSALLGGIGVDLQAWREAPPVVEPMCFLLVGRLLREKGIVEYAAAARWVKERYPRTRFVLLGGLDSNPGGLSRAQVQAWVDEDLLEWPGYVPVRPWLERASVFVLPSYREGVPLSTQEAMAMGRPVITTDVPGCRETVRDGVNGYLVPARDAAALAKAMLRFLDDPGRVASMGRASRRMAESCFDVRKINQKLSAWLLE